jgi:hypothetical protein
MPCLSLCLGQLCRVPDLNFQQRHRVRVRDHTLSDRVIGKHAGHLRFEPVILGSQCLDFLFKAMFEHIASAALALDCLPEAIIVITGVAVRFGYVSGCQSGANVIEIKVVHNVSLPWAMTAQPGKHLNSPDRYGIIIASTVQIVHGEARAFLACGSFFYFRLVISACMPSSTSANVFNRLLILEYVDQFVDHVVMSGYLRMQIGHQRFQCDDSLFGSNGWGVRRFLLSF